ncbi:MAG: hypothetical protein J5742_02590 [Alphaproteobacteria bacterium]|nr:hypothetical protein [Alphaproteobacteria bacterium]
MKKIAKFLAIFSAIAGMGICDASADCNWLYWTRGARGVDRNDYLWKNAREYNDTAVRDGQAYAVVCGGLQKGTCWDGDVITAPAEHVFEGQVVPYSRKYKCVAGLSADHRWEPLSDGNVCPSFRFERATIRLAKGQTYPNQNDVTMTREGCQKITNESLDPYGIRYQVKCNNSLKLECVLKDCKGGYVPSGNRCVEKTTPPKPNNCKVTLKGKSVTVEAGHPYSEWLTAQECKSVVPSAVVDENALYQFWCGPECKEIACKDGYVHNEKGNCIKKGSGKTCRESRAGMSVEAIACCDTGTAAKWDGSRCNCKDLNTHFEIVNGRGQCVANGGGNTNRCPSDAVPSADNTTCICTDQNKEFNSTLRQCVAKGNVVHTCPDHMVWDESKNQCECIELNQRKQGDKCVCAVPDAKNDENGICQCNDKEKVVKDGKCEYDESILAKIRAEISATYGRLNASVGGFEKSVWKDEDGNFNTARLASDSIAGVVLGTAGGIITSKIVKKNQLKQGFEDIKCSIGGQTVASYGDTFSVGM